MNWPTAIPEDPKDGDVRIVKRFIWFLPEDILGTTYWLETVNYCEKFKTATCEGAYHGWLPCPIEEWGKWRLQDTQILNWKQKSSKLNQNSKKRKIS